MTPRHARRSLFKSRRWLAILFICILVVNGIVLYLTVAKQSVKIGGIYGSAVLWVFALLAFDNARQMWRSGDIHYPETGEFAGTRETAPFAFWLGVVGSTVIGCVLIVLGIIGCVNAITWHP
jgi:hypothetical protein